MISGAPTHQPHEATRRTSPFNFFVQLKSAHGSLLRSSTHGFVMSTAGRLTDPIRMKDLTTQLHNLGLNPRIAR